jgi:hypothetical protein
MDRSKGIDSSFALHRRRLIAKTTMLSAATVALVVGAPSLAAESTRGAAGPQADVRTVNDALAAAAAGTLCGCG